MSKWFSFRYLGTHTESNTEMKRTCRFEFWCVTTLSMIFQFMAASFIGGGNRSTRRKPLTCRKSMTNFIIWFLITTLASSNSSHHIILHRFHPPWAEFELTMLVVIDTDCTGSCKSDYHTNTTTTAPETHMYNPVDLQNIIMKESIVLKAKVIAMRSVDIETSKTIVQHIRNM
jgi:hypothetical protein